MTLNDKEIIQKLKIERDYLQARINKVNKALEAFDGSPSISKRYTPIGKKVNCTKCKREYVAFRIKKNHFCSIECRPSVIARVNKNNSKGTTLIKGDSLSH